MLFFVLTDLFATSVMAIVVIIKIRTIGNKLSNYEFPCSLAFCVTGRENNSADANVKLNDGCAKAKMAPLSRTASMQWFGEDGLSKDTSNWLFPSDCMTTALKLFYSHCNMSFALQTKWSCSLFLAHTAYEGFTARYTLVRFQGV